MRKKAESLVCESHMSDVVGWKGVERPELRVGSPRYRAHALTTLRKELGTSILTNLLVSRLYVCVKLRKRRVQEPRSLQSVGALSNWRMASKQCHAHYNDALSCDFACQAFRFLSRSRRKSWEAWRRGYHYSKSVIECQD